MCRTVSRLPGLPGMMVVQEAGKPAGTCRCALQRLGINHPTPFPCSASTWSFNVPPCRRSETAASTPGGQGLEPGATVRRGRGRSAAGIDPGAHMN